MKHFKEDLLKNIWRGRGKELPSYGDEDDAHNVVFVLVQMDRWKTILVLFFSLQKFIT